MMQQHRRQSYFTWQFITSLHRYQNFKCILNQEATNLGQKLDYKFVFQRALNYLMHEGHTIWWKMQTGSSRNEKVIF
jgi:hypothetical protein